MSDFDFFSFLWVRPTPVFDNVNTVPIARAPRQPIFLTDDSGAFLTDDSGAFLVEGPGGLPGYFGSQFYGSQFYDSAFWSRNVLIPVLRTPGDLYRFV